MAAKAKLTLSQLLFRRGPSSNNSNCNANTNNNNNEENCKNEHCSNGNSNSHTGQVNNSSNHSSPPRKVSLGSSTVSANGGGKRRGFYEIATPSEIVRPKSSQSHHKPSSSQQQPQLQGILKKPNKNVGLDVGFGAGKPTRSSLHRSRSNPNPSNNPLKEVSWSCPTLEKRREVILNYFERIILENKQEQNSKVGRNKPNIPCETVNVRAIVPQGEPIYEEISDCSLGNFSSNNSQSDKTGSLKPKLGPKKVRMNIPQDQQHQNQSNKNSNGGSPIYDKLLCRSQSMIEPLSSSSPSSSASSYSGSGYYDVAPSISASVSSSSSASQSLYENFRPSYPSSESDYGGFPQNANNNNNNNNTGGSTPTPKVVGTRIAGRSHSFHDNYRSSGSSYNIQVDAKTQHLETDQIYAKVCKRKKMKACGSNNNEQQGATHQHQQYQNAPPQPQLPHQRHQSSSSSSSSTFSTDDNTLSVQVSCGNVVTMIPVIMPCSSSFSTSCLSLSSSSDNNNEDTIFATTSSSTTVAAIRNNEHENDSNGYIHYDEEKILPDKEIGYASKSCEPQDNHNNNSHSRQHHHQYHHHHHHHQRAYISAAAGSRNNLSVIHLLAAYDPQKEIEEFIPTTPTFTAIIDSTECAPKSISVPVRVVDFTSSGTTSNHHSSFNNGNTNNTSTVLLTNEEEEEEEEEEVCYQYLPASSTPSTAPTQRPLMVTNCSFSYDAEEDDDYDDEDEEDEDKEQEKMYSTSSSTSGSSSSDEDHQEMKYSFTDGRLVNRAKSISFQDDSITKDILLLTSDSEDDEELCEHKSLLDMTSTNGSTDIMDDSGIDKGEKYLALMDDEDRGFDSFLDDNEGSVDPKNDNPFRAENLKNQRTFAQSQQDVPPEALKNKAASVLDLINSEISDLHMRELELKKLHSPSPPHSPEKMDKEINDDNNTGEEFEEGSSGEDDFSDSAIEYDGFTTNGSHSSGQVSPSENLNEMGGNHQEENEQEQASQPGNDEEEKEEIQEEKEVDEIPKDSVDNNQPHTPGEHKVRPLAEEDDKSIKFESSDETPIEREIRLTREREEEFRRLNNLSINNPPSPKFNERSSPTNAQKQKLGSLPVKSTSVSYRPENEMPSLPVSGVTKDLQYEMATARFKREIEESMKREKELVLEGRLKKGVTEGDEESNQNETPAQEEELKTPEEQPTPSPTPLSPAPPPPPPQEQQPQQKPENVLRKPTIAKLPINKLPAARFFSPPAYNGNKPNRITPVVSPIIAKGSLTFPSPNGSRTAAVGGSLPIGISRPSFNSLEKYILQSSSINYKPIVASQTSIDEEPAKSPASEPSAVNKSLSNPEDPLRIVQKASSIDEEIVSEEKEEEEKPKRRYIPAQDKIQKEIQELVMREKELNRTRAKWKSTLDLPESMKDTEESNQTQTTQSSLSLHASSSTSRDNVAASVAVAEEEGEETQTKVDNDENNEELDTKRATEDARQVTRVKAPARRRNSWLINQWEERIRQQQQTNNKK